MSILRKEILQQPDVVKSLLTLETNHIDSICTTLRNRFRYVVIAARGTSDNAARYAQYLLGAQNHIQVALATPSLFSIYKSPPDLTDALVIGISQSGQSPDIIAVLSEAKRKGCPTLAITNSMNSPLAKQAEFIIPIHTGVEKAVAATKTYTASLAALAIFSKCLQQDIQGVKRLELLPSIMEETLNASLEKLDHVERFRYIEYCAVLGRGYNYATAFEVALKVKELTRVVAEPYSSADFRHGPIATAQPGFPIIIISPQGKISADMHDLIKNLDCRGAEIILISNQITKPNIFKLSFQIPIMVDEWLSPLVAVLPGQLFAMQLAKEKNLDIDNPAGLTKITNTL
jgi:glucosamine--fructose-6-phosphate aminotransferase (isomerizing)